MIKTSNNSSDILENYYRIYEQKLPKYLDKITAFRAKVKYR
jgi:hypothetical protein